MKCLIFFCLCLLGLCMQAQTYTWEDFVQQMQEEEYAEEEGWWNYMEDLELMHQHPLDINTATREELLALPFLDEQQVEDIHTYIFLHRGMRTLSELMGIESIDYNLRRILSLFLYAGQEVFSRTDTIDFKHILKNAHHEFITRMDIPLYYRVGYQHSPENGGYAGSTLYNKILYRMQSMKKMQFGLHAEKDQGEPFKHNKGYDSYGGYLLVKDVKWIRSAIVGDYKLGFGEGLVINNGFSMGKTILTRSNFGIKGNSGTEEVNFLRGAATTLRWGLVDISAWFSYRELDATLNDDGEVVTFVTGGYHRTQTELGKKNNVGSMLGGGDVTWSNKGFRLGATGYGQYFSRTLNPGTQQYRKYYPQGTRFGVIGSHYGYMCRWFTFSGETAFSTQQKGIATLNKLNWKINSRYSLTGWQRFYSTAYYSFYASALSENSKVQDENGGMIRLDAQPLYGWTVTAYADFFYNIWPLYGMTHSSVGQDIVLQNDVVWKTKHKISLRTQLKRKEKSDIMLTHLRWRLQYSYIPSDRLRLQSMLNLHTVSSSTGMALSQNVRYTFSKPALCLTGMLSYFHTPDYNTRVYVYEPTLRYSFSYGSLFGHGVRSSFTGTYSFWKKRLVLEAKYGCTCYFDRTVQSSGMQQIMSRWKNDISLQIRIKM